MMKNFLFSGLLSFLIVGAQAQQRPFINSLDRTSGNIGETITISGSGFSNNMQVLFGTGVATVTSSDPTLLQVTVPITATQGRVTALDLNTGLSGVSTQFFTPSFEGDGFEIAEVDPIETFATNELFTYDLCGCDFDGDDKTDIAVANRGSDIINLYRNTSTINAVSFAETQLDNGSFTSFAECGDLDGDGKPDMVFSTPNEQNPNHIFIFRNTSTVGSLSFTKTNFRLPADANDDQRRPRKFKIADMDGDGKKDLVIGVESDNNVIIYRNTTSGTSITFGSPLVVTLTGLTNCGSVDVADINGNGLLDIVTLPWNQSGEPLAVLINQSGPGNLSFAPQRFGDNGSRINLVIADADGDGKPDVLTTNRSANQIEVFRNTSNNGAVSFANSSLITGITSPWSIATGDMDGDGLVDFTVTSTTNTMGILENTSTSGSISFNLETLGIADDSRNVRVFDVNGDFKPDVNMTYNSSQSTNGSLAILVNRNCLNPSIGPSGLTFCVGDPFTVSATKSAGASYAWSVTSGDATITPSGDQATITANTDDPVTVQVTLTGDDGNCTDAVTQNFTLTNGSTPPAPTISNSATGTICAGQSFTLSGPGGQDQYLWTFPDGTEINISTDSQTITSASSSDAGIYTLRVQQGSGCFSEAGTIEVAIDEPPVVAIQNLDQDEFCAGSTVTLSVPDYDGFSFQWKDNNTDISGETGNALEATASGQYSVAIISDASTCQYISDTYSVTAVSPPTSSFISDTEICEDVALMLTANSTDNSGGSQNLTYAWDFDDGNTATGQDVSNSFVTPGEYNVALTTGYEAIDACTSTANQTITVSATPTINITSATGIFEKCPNDSLRLELPANFLSYNWSTGSTDSFAFATTSPQEDQVNITVTMVTDISCTVNSEVTVSNFANSRIDITSTDATIINDTISLDENTTSVTLQATGGSGLQWMPTDILDNSNTATVVATPRDRFTTVSVTGTDDVNGCETTATVVIETPGVIPRKSFSPNGDGIGYECWEILNGQNLQGCNIYIFDQKGSYVFQGEAPFTENCVWNGNIDNGAVEAPEGIYFFVLKCDDSRFSQTGSIILGR